MPYRFRDDIVTADIAFEAEGETFEELFTAASEALLHVQLENTASLKHRYAFPIHLQDQNEEMLLHGFLQELIYYKDAQSLFLSVTAIRILRHENDWILDATAEGEPVAPERHSLGLDVKAVTWHLFGIEEREDGYRALVVLDV